MAKNKEVIADKKAIEEMIAGRELLLDGLKWEARQASTQRIMAESSSSFTAEQKHQSRVAETKAKAALRKVCSELALLREAVKNAV